MQDLEADVGGARQTIGQYSPAIGLGLGIAQGGTAGTTQAATSAAKLASNAGLFGTAGSAVGSLAGDVANLGNIVQGINQGGALGYAGAGINAAMLAGNVMQQGASMGLLSAATGDEGLALSSFAGPAAGALSLYEFARNWQSGATGSDALSGAEAGATIGTGILPGVGTLAGGLIGGAVGAASSLFGPGKMDPENQGWDAYAQAFDKSGAAGVSGATPANNFQALAGMFDARGSTMPMYEKYGRMGENQFTTDMFGIVNQALKSGKVASNATPQQIYSKVVQPWIQGMEPGGWQASNTAKGSPEQAAMGNLLTSMIGQWQSGQFTSSSKVGIDGQTVSTGVPTYGADGFHAGTQAAQQQAQTAMAPVSQATSSLGNIFGGTSTQSLTQQISQQLGGQQAAPAPMLGGQNFSWLSSINAGLF